MIATSQGEQGAIDRLEAALKELDKDGRPKVMNPNRAGNILTKLELSYEKLMLSLEESGFANARKMSVFSLEAAIEKNQQEAQRLKNGAAKQE